MKKSNIKTWSQIKGDQFGKVGSPNRDELEREYGTFRIGILLRQARESKSMTQEQLGVAISRKRSYISRVENNGSNITLKTLFDIVEKGLGGKVTIGIKV